MKLRVIQKDVHNRDIRAFLDKARESRPDIVAFGELALTGCLYDGGQGVTLDSLVADLKDHPYAIMIGFPENDGGTLYNTYLYYHDGAYNRYRKINLFPPMNEPEVYSPGTDPVVLETKWGRLGVAICYDVRFPEVFQKLKEDGAEIFIVPAAFPLVRIHDWRRLLAERAKDCNVPVVGINAVGDDGTNEFGGSSMYIAPTGDILYQADETSEIVKDLQISLSR